MKKTKFCITFIFFAFLFSTAIFAETGETRKVMFSRERCAWDRYWEIGVTAHATVSNNFLTITDIFQEEIVLNLNKMDEQTNFRGFVVGSNIDVRVFSNLFLKNFNIGFDVGANALLSVDLKKDLISFLANGNEYDKTYDIGVGVGGAVFADLKIPVGFAVNKKKMRFTITPSLFVPVAYIPYADAVVKTKFGANGALEMTGATTVSLYSCLPLTDFSSMNFFNIMSASGFDIDFRGEIELIKQLDLGFSVTHIPIVPSHLASDYKYDADISFTTNDNGVLDTLYQNKGIDTENFKFNITPTPPATSERVYRYVLRPLKFALWLNWRPVTTTNKQNHTSQNSDILVLRPFVQFRFMDSSVSNKAGFGFDYALTVMANLKWGVFDFTTAYIDNKFRQELNMAFNVRFFELDIGIATESASFLKSFCGTGFAAKITIILGV